MVSRLVSTGCEKEEGAEAAFQRSHSIRNLQSASKNPNPQIIFATETKEFRNEVCSGLSCYVMLKVPSRHTLKLGYGLFIRVNPGVKKSSNPNKHFLEHVAVAIIQKKKDKMDRDAFEWCEGQRGLKGSSLKDTTVCVCHQMWTRPIWWCVAAGAQSR